MTLEDRTVWSLLIVLDVDSETATDLAPDTCVGLADTNGESIGLFDVSEVYTYDDQQVAEQVFGTTDDATPVSRTFTQEMTFW